MDQMKIHTETLATILARAKEPCWLVMWMFCQKDVNVKDNEEGSE